MDSVSVSEQNVDTDHCDVDDTNAVTNGDVDTNAVNHCDSETDSVAQCDPETDSVAQCDPETDSVTQCDPAPENITSVPEDQSENRPLESSTNDEEEKSSESDGDPSAEVEDVESCDERRLSDPLDEALESVENLDVRVKDEPLDNVGDILMDDELRLQLEESIEMVVNELSTPDNDGSTDATNFEDNDIESSNDCDATNETTTNSNSLDPMMDSMNDLEGTLDPDLQAVCDVLRMANAASPILGRSPSETRHVEDVPATSNKSTKESVNANVKCEPHDSGSSKIFSAVTCSPSFSSSSVSSVATVSSSNEIFERERSHSSNPIDMLTLLSLDKKPSALSILPVKSDKNLPSAKVTKDNFGFPLMPDVTIRSVPSSMYNSTQSSNKYLPTSEECSKVLPRKNPGLTFNLPTDSKLARDNSMLAQSPDSLFPLPYTGANAKTTHTNPSSMALACCSTLPSRFADASNNCGVYYNQKTSSLSRPASSCSYSNYNNCRRMSPYPPQYHHVSYSGMRSPGARVTGPYGMPASRPFHPSNAAIYSPNPAMNGAPSCCTSVPSPMSPSSMMNSKASNYPALPSLLPPSPLNQCRMPLSPSSPSFARSTREYANIFPDSTGSSSESALACMQQQQQGFRPTGSAWGNPARSSFSLPSPKPCRGSSAVVQHSSSPNKNQMYPHASPGYGYPMAPKNGPSGAVGPTNAYGGEDFASSSVPFQRAQCCFSSQIQCFNAACDNSAQQQVSIIQHSTRLSNLKANSMDSISSLLHYHSYFKKY